MCYLMQCVRGGLNEGRKATKHCEIWMQVILSLALYSNTKSSACNYLKGLFNYCYNSTAVLTVKLNSLLHCTFQVCCGICISQHQVSVKNLPINSNWVWLMTSETCILHTRMSWATPLCTTAWLWLWPCKYCNMLSSNYSLQLLHNLIAFMLNSSIPPHSCALL